MSSALSVSTIRPPELASASGKDVVKFSLAYRRYLTHIETTNAQLPKDRRVKAISRKACFHPDFIESLVMVGDFGDVEKVDQVTEAMVIKWLDERGRCSTE